MTMFSKTNRKTSILMHFLLRMCRMLSNIIHNYAFSSSTNIVQKHTVPRMRFANSNFGTNVPVLSGRQGCNVGVSVTTGLRHFYFLSVAQQPNWGLGRLCGDVSTPHTRQDSSEEEISSKQGPTRTLVPTVVFEPSIPGIERPQTYYGFDIMATGIGPYDTNKM